ncbi:MAG: hypothetical protein IJ003_06525 [Candidatus Gastranaerophilales bacterium]|nr:hypothetical protein [Candidatus Gastranaerophilales bacterium]
MNKITRNPYYLNKQVRLAKKVNIGIMKEMNHIAPINSSINAKNLFNTGEIINAALSAIRKILNNK